MPSDLDPPISVWELLRNPVVTIFQENFGKAKVLGILEVINNSCQCKKNWYLPSICSSLSHDERCLIEQQYTAFCSWLLGRLLYLLGVESLSEIHDSCIKAQIQILEVCSENWHMKQVLFQEYLGCLQDLIEMHTSESALHDGQQLLRRFTPIPEVSLAKLDLTPKYIPVSSCDLIKSLEKSLVQILGSMVLNVAYTHEGLVEEFKHALSKLLWLADPVFRVAILKICTKIFSIVGYKDKIAITELCNALNFVVSSLPHDIKITGTETAIELQVTIAELVNAMISFESSSTDDSRNQSLLSVLQSLLTAWDFENSSCSALNMACNNTVTLLKSVPRGSASWDLFTLLLKRSPTQQYAVEILEKWMLEDLLYHIKSTFGSSYNTNKKLGITRPKTEVNAVSLPIWALYHQQLWEDITMVLDSFNRPQPHRVHYQLHDILGKVQTLIRSAVGLDLVSSSQDDIKNHNISFCFFHDKVGELLSFFRSVVLMVKNIEINSPPKDFYTSIWKSVVFSVRNLVLLPEMSNCAEADAALAVSLLSLPWLEGGETSDLQIDAELNSPQRLLQNGNCTELKAASLHALGAVPHNVSPIWRASLFMKAISCLKNRQPQESDQQVNILLASSAIQAFPSLLMDPSQSATELLSDILFPALHIENETILVSLSEVFSPVVCILGGKYVTTCVISNGVPRQSHVCKTCNKDFSGLSVNASNHLSQLKDTLNEFMMLLTSPVTAVRRNMANSLGDLVLHLPAIYQPDVVLKWMKYAEDPDFDVRMIFSQMVKFLIFQRDWMEGKEMESEHLREEHIPLTQVDRAELLHSRPRLDRVLQMLVNILNDVFTNNIHKDVTLQDTLLLTIVDIGCVPLDCVLLPVLKIVLMFVSHPSFSHPAIAQVYLQKIADAHNSSVKNLYHRYQSDICEVLVSLAGMNFHNRPNWTKFMDKVLYGMGFASTVTWLRQSVNCIMPIVFTLVVKFNDRLFLEEILNLMQPKKTGQASIIRDCFQYIFPWVFLHENDDVCNKCVKLTQELSQTDHQDLLIAGFKTIHNELLLHYHCKKERVEEGIHRLIRVLAKQDKQSKVPSQPIKQDIAGHLENRFIGVLIHFETLLESTWSEESVKIKALQSLPMIIRLMGPKYITPIRFKVLSTLQTALRLTHCDFPHLSCSAWEAFIHSVEVNVLGQLLGTVVASLLPLLEQYPAEIAAMFRWLVLEHENDMTKYITDLFFLPNKPAISSVFSVVQRHLAIQKRHSTSMNISDFLQQPLRFILHDSVDIRRYGLKHLLSLVKEKQMQFTRALLAEDMVHPNVLKLLNLLVEGCQDPDLEIRLLCVENLGVIGALDPGQLPHKKPDINLPHIVDVKDDEFATQALTVLAKAYQTARNTRFLDSFAVAIQELLKHYDISSNENHPKKHLWNSFPDSVQQVMAPLENTFYYMTSLTSNPVWPHPLFGTRYAVSLTSWAHTWACRIVTSIEDFFVQSVFTACIPSLRTDVNCVLFFLPFIVLYAVILGQEQDHKMMEEEMTYIIQLPLKEEEETQINRQTEKFQVRMNSFTSLPTTADSDRATHAICAKAVFSLLDFMEKWVGKSKKQIDKKQGVSLEKHSQQVQNVQRFLARFSKLDLAYGNYGVKEYARALMYLEDHLMEKPNSLENHLNFLGRIYAQMNEADGIKGVLAVQGSEPKLLESVVYHEVMDQHQEALSCYEHLAKQHRTNELSLGIQKGMVRCCLSLDQPSAALGIAAGAIANRPEWRSAFLEAQVECFWRIQSMDDLENILEDPKLEDSTAWSVSIGRCLVNIRHCRLDEFLQHLKVTRSLLGRSLSTASLERGSYLQGYPHVIKLHMLHELEAASSVISLIQSPEASEQTCITSVENLVKVWKSRLGLVQAVSGMQEPLLRLHRCILQLAESAVRPGQDALAQLLGKELGCSWLKSAKVACKAGCYQQAYVYLLNAKTYKPKRHFIELAKYHWKKSDQEHALSTLKRGLEEHFPNWKDFQNETTDCDTMTEDRKTCAKAQLLNALYNRLAMNVDVDRSLENHQNAVKVYGAWEKSHASLAAYYENIFLSGSEGVRDVQKFGAYQRCAVSSFIKSMKFGCSQIYCSMSRMLTIWLDYGKRYQIAMQDYSASKSSCAPEIARRKLALVKERNSILDQMNECISGNVDSLPPFLFMTGFSQLVSRLCHPVSSVNEVIKTIIVKVLSSYPQQTMWMLLAMYRSTYPLRKKRCQAVFDDQRIKSNPELVKLIGDFTKLGHLLSELCHKPVPKDVTKTSVHVVVEQLPRLLADRRFSKIILPLQSSRILTLPKRDYSSLESHAPFELNPPCIASIKDEIIILQSLQKPRKITLLGTDGKRYEMMCKDKDDLRLDARVMEFNTIVNKYLQKDPSSRSRRLNIRTYSVVPLNEDSGLIEWVPNLMGYRHIVTNLYKEIGSYTTNAKIKKYVLENSAPLALKRDKFLNNLIPLHPPVFRNWFRNTFTDSCSWFEARKSYVHTSAVMSMVGYILGLGDRHGENILLDTTCGNVVHVDFNCLFNKGEKFECPERVPFRLTHNMVAAMGPTGVEGPFRHACEITLRMMREKREMLLSILQPFVYDPLVAWSHKPQLKRKPDQDEMTNDTAVEDVKNIDNRLNGLMKVGDKMCDLQLSVEGQVALLITEATSIDNLCQMYIGWGAYM